MLRAAFPHDRQHHQPQRGVRTQQPMLPVPLQQEQHA
jgi:hypothetical protein